MAEYKFKHRIYSIVEEVSPATVTFETLNRLWVEFIDLCEQAQSQELVELASMFQIAENSNPDAKKNYERIKLLLQNHNRPMIVVYGADGQRFSFVPAGNQRVFDSIELPHRIQWIKFENHSNFEYATKEYVKSFILEVHLDFSNFRLAPFDPEDRTYKSKSYIRVQGLMDNWTYGSVKKLQNVIGQSPSWVPAILHRHVHFTIFTWLVSVPLTLLALNKVSEKSTAIESLKPGIAGIFYFTLALLLMQLIRVVFNYTKWLFPYLEIVEQPKKFQLLQRTVAAALLLTIFSSFVGLLIESLFFK